MAKIAIFTHDPYCSRQCAAAVAAVLKPEHEIYEFGLSDLTHDRLSVIDLLVMPGGDGDADRFRSLFTLRRDVVQRFVQEGGSYLGICMGAYWGGRNYFGLLPHTECVQYITRPRAEVRRSFKTTVRIEWDGAADSMYFYDGCTFLTEVDRFETIARYRNGDPMAIMMNRVGLIGCHPESTREWYDTPALLAEWHHGRHHQLLRDFVARLISPANGFTVPLLDRLEADAEPGPALLHEAAEEIRTLRATLQSIKDATDAFAHGTLRQVNHLAREGLAHMTTKTIPHKEDSSRNGPTGETDSSG